MGRSISLVSDSLFQWQPSISQPQPSFADKLTSTPTVFLQFLLVVGLVLILLRAHRIVQIAARIPSCDRWMLGFWSIAGLVLRLWDGIRVPGWVNSHGYELLRDVLIGVPGLQPDPHGHAFHALYGLLISVLPATEITIISFQCILSVACIPLVYLVASFWFENNRLAIWSAAAMAVTPAVCFYAATEVHLVPGCFFMLLVMVLIGLCIRHPDWILLATTAVLGAVTSQFYPVFMLLPVVGLLFLLSAPGGGLSLLRSGKTWAAIGLFFVLWLGPAMWMMSLVVSRPGGAIGPEIIQVLQNPSLLITPTFSLSSGLHANTFLNQYFVPPVFVLLALIGLVTSIRTSKTQRRRVLSLLGCALVMTLPGLFAGGMNPSRLQLGSMPFYAMLTGCGLAWVTGTIRLTSARKQKFVRQFIGVTIVFVSVVVFPGVLGRSFTPQLERRVFKRGLSSVENGCLVIWPPHPRGGNNPIPYYLAEQQGRALRWGNLLEPRVPKRLLEEHPCTYYYRPSTCFLVLHDKHVIELMKFSPEGLHPVCARVERQLRLSPVHLEHIPNRPDYIDTYSLDEMEIGFSRVDGVLPREPKEKDPL